MIFLRMSVVVTSFLKDKAPTILASLALCIFTVLHFINKSHVLLYLSVSGKFHEYFIVISPKNNSDQ
jgi:hypothetical protein